MLHMKKAVILLLLSALFAVGCKKKEDNNEMLMKLAAIWYSFMDMTSLEFDEITAASTTDEKHQVRATSVARINGIPHTIGFHTIVRAGDQAGSQYYGRLIDINGNPIANAGTTYSNGISSIGNNSGSDFHSLITKDGSLFMIGHIEQNPGGAYITKLTQAADGNLTPAWTKNINFSEYKGLYIPCAGSVSPWGTHLGSEEYEPNASKLGTGGAGRIDAYYDPITGYFTGNANDFSKMADVNPYWYGWIPEITIANAAGDVSVTKHFSMGRFSHELASVMPDQKTVYLSDDGNNVALFMFIADTAGNLTAGTLYAAKWEQTSTANATDAAANIKWISLGHATDSEIKSVLLGGVNANMTDTTITPLFSDLFTVGTATGETCNVGTYIVTSTGAECLELKIGSIGGVSIDKLASRLETRRYAALKGATTEFQKEEGIAFNKFTKKLYIAYSDISKGMQDEASAASNNAAAVDHIKLAKNSCGGVFAGDMQGGKLDSSGNAISSDYVLSTLYSEVLGIAASAADSYFTENDCKLTGISSPDNLHFIQGTKTLIIGEDTGTGHQNDMIWSYNIETKKLTRILTTPYGSETTSPYFYHNVNGFGYLMTVIQHPYGETDKVNTTSGAIDALAPTLDSKRFYIGYIGPFPATFDK